MQEDDSVALCLQVRIGGVTSQTEPTSPSVVAVNDHNFGQRVAAESSHHFGRDFTHLCELHCLLCLEYLVCFGQVCLPSDRRVHRSLFFAVRLRCQAAVADELYQLSTLSSLHPCVQLIYND